MARHSSDGAPSSGVLVSTRGPSRERAHEDERDGSLAKIQRARILDATIRAACERGAARLTVADVIERAGISRRTFYELFKDSQDCLLAAIDDCEQRARQRVRSAIEATHPAPRMAAGARGPQRWSEQVKVGLAALLALFDEQPQLAQLLVVEWLAAGPAALERRRRLLEQITQFVDRGRGEGVRASQAPLLAGEGAVGGVMFALHSRLAAGKPPPRLLDLTNPLMSTIVLPYLGPAAARKELERPLPDIPANGRGEVLPKDLLKGLEMRLTYRTVRVLAAAAAHPNGSNRTIARAAGIGDQGQISKLLMRLQRLGLLENKISARSRKGEANAWALSAKGERVERMLRV